MTDFTAYDHPVLAIACPTCGAEASIRCRGPAGHATTDPHRSARWRPTGCPSGGTANSPQSFIPHPVG